MMIEEGDVELGTVEPSEHVEACPCEAAVRNDGGGAGSGMGSREVLPLRRPGRCERKAAPRT